MRIPTKKLIMELSTYTGTNDYILLNVSKMYKYVDGQRTDTIEGVRYKVVNPLTFENFDIKVTSTREIISQDSVDESEERIWVTFEDAYIQPYRIEFGNALVSVKALSARLVDKPANFVF